MNVIYSIEDAKDIKETSVTIGNFDGVHVAHQKIIRDVVEKAKEKHYTSVLITFDPHPLKYFQKAQVKLLQTLKQKLEIMAILEIDIIVLLSFDEILANMTASQFVENILVKKFHARELYMGYNFQFGKDKEGDSTLIQKLSKKHNFNFYIQQAVIVDGIVCNSTTIRNFIENGDVDTAMKLLDRHFTISGTVIKGSGLGKLLGYPTINIQTENELLPHDGVYLTYINHNNNFYPSITNIGFRPTFKGKNRTVESFIIDFEKILYDEQIHLLFIKKIRNEIQFSSSLELAEQITKDVEYARNYFDKTQSPL
ncbi:MAG: riboflavin biosynthesis protein RibF [Candidatus Fischerbacteria bacterium RBG_13_37_8]|uniref:Riboflavin biosynthesis protein n=1 Tax=Candidatus Fischerbacteria bacterium RBG_13_37_8 TaxID=1817863 RepID=A0A1F5VUT2_9BACT|nr:MAG: riboflavin biosynthesis protein RibF [Candidatus Fischerbacteria bacterium RBG_13_37_8]